MSHRKHRSGLHHFPTYNPSSVWKHPPVFKVAPGYKPPKVPHLGAFPRLPLRPPNACAACGYTWYPRGHNRSPRCPSCGSETVSVILAGDGGKLVAIFAAISLIIVLLFFCWPRQSTTSTDPIPSSVTIPLPTETKAHVRQVVAVAPCRAWKDLKTPLGTLRVGERLETRGASDTITSVMISGQKGWVPNRCVSSLD